MKIKTQLIGICFMLLYNLSAFGQSNSPHKSQNSISLKIGGNNAFFQDYQISKLHYQQQGLVYGLAYSRRNSNSIFSASLDYHGIDLKTDVSEFFTFSGNHVANLKLDYLRKLKTLGPKMSVYLGLQYKFNFNYFNWGDQDSFTFLVTHGLSPAAELEYALSEKHVFKTNLSVPLLAVVVRPPWAGYDLELEENTEKPLKLITNGPVNTINKYISIDWMFNYSNQLSESLSLELEYRFQYQYLKGPKQLNYLQHQATVGLTKKF